jgi:hypothetical protein
LHPGNVLDQLTLPYTGTKLSLAKHSTFKEKHDKKQKKNNNNRNEGAGSENIPVIRAETRKMRSREKNKHISGRLWGPCFRVIFDIYFLFRSDEIDSGECEDPHTGPSQHGDKRNGMWGDQRG